MSFLGTRLTITFDYNRNFTIIGSQNPTMDNIIIQKKSRRGPRRSSRIASRYPTRRSRNLTTINLDEYDSDSSIELNELPTTRQSQSGRRNQGTNQNHSVVVLSDDEEETMTANGNNDQRSSGGTEYQSIEQARNAALEDILDVVDDIVDADETLDNAKSSQRSYGYNIATIMSKANELIKEINSRKIEPEKTESSPLHAKQCPICLDDFGKKPLGSTTCGHVFCLECITNVAKRTKLCPICRKAISLKKIHPLFL